MLDQLTSADNLSVVDLSPRAINAPVQNQGLNPAGALPRDENVNRNRLELVDDVERSQEVIGNRDH